MTKYDRTMDNSINGESGNIWRKKANYATVQTKGETVAAREKRRKTDRMTLKPERNTTWRQEQNMAGNPKIMQRNRYEV